MKVPLKSLVKSLANGIECKCSRGYGAALSFYIMSKGRVHKKKPEKVWSFAKPGGGGVSEGSKMPNLYFGVLKRVKNGLKMAKKHIEILYFS